MSAALAGPLAAAAFAARAAVREPRVAHQAELQSLLVQWPADERRDVARSGDRLLRRLGFDAVDPTGYYFKGYPAPAADDEVYRIKHRAFRAGLDISGTGVRNNFVLADGPREMRKWHT